MLEINKIKAFLTEVDKSFPVPLSDKQDLNILAEKFAKHATVCKIEEKGKIVAMVSGYTENVTDNMAYISVVASLPCARGKGYATKLVLNFIGIARSKKLSAIHLYTVRSNIAAVRMYEKIGFTEYLCEDETRPDDLHLIYHIEKEE